jgi:hypothetical protein
MFQTDTLELAILTELARVGVCTLDELHERLPSYFMEPGVCRGGQAQPRRQRHPPASGLVRLPPLARASTRRGMPRDAGRIPGEPMTPRVYAIQETSMLLVARSHPTASSVS